MIKELRKSDGLMGKVFGYKELVFLAEIEQGEKFLVVERSETDQFRPTLDVRFEDEVSLDEVLASPSDFFLVRGRVAIAFLRNSEGEAIDYDLYGDDIKMIWVDGGVEDYPHGTFEECPTVFWIKD